MKVIALLPFKNEEWILPTYLSSVVPLVDLVISVDDGSTDRSREIMENAGDKVVVYDNDALTDVAWSEHHIRETLLRLGREAGGTHFVCLDADEAFTGVTKRKWVKLLRAMEPGTKLHMQWLANWKTLDHYRDDHSVWSNNFKDFVVCDKEGISYPYNWLHVGRTPGPNTSETLLRVNPKHAAIHHFQFSDFRNFQIKQCYLRCSELIKHPGTEAAINNKYRITLDDPNAQVRGCPPEWMDGLVLPDMSVERTWWRKQALFDYFDKYGIDYFRKLDIWHVPEIKEKLT